MSKEVRRVIYDNKLNVEVLSFCNIEQSFPKHFHDYYVIGYVKKSNRNLICNERKYFLKGGEILLLNPNDYHECSSNKDETFEYSAIHITKEEIDNLSYEMFGINKTTVFTKNVIYDFSMIEEFEEMITMLFNESNSLKKEELFYLIIRDLLENYADFKETERNISKLKVNEICNFIQMNYADDLTLEELSKIAGISKYHFIRLFTREVGTTPYKYLELTRINKAKKMLQNGISIIEVAISNGFSDQSHFTNLFKKTIGITPKQYQVIFEERKTKNEREKMCNDSR